MQNIQNDNYVGKCEKQCMHIKEIAALIEVCDDMKAHVLYLSSKQIMHVCSCKHMKRWSQNRLTEYEL